MGILHRQRRHYGSAEAPAVGRRRNRLVKPFDRALWLRRGRWLFATLLAMAGAAHLLLAPPDFLFPQQPQSAAVRPGWTEIRKPIALYGFAGGQFGHEPAHYAARRHSDGSRADTLTFGNFPQLAQARTPWMRVKILRRRNNARSKSGFFVQIARLAAGEGLAVTRSVRPRLVESRFGAFAVADIEISGANGKSACLGFVRQPATPALDIAGIVCGTAATPVDRKLLACSLSRLYLISARDDAELRRFFARTELRHNGACLGGKLAGMRNRASWLELPAAGAAVSALRLTPTRARLNRR